MSLLVGSGPKTVRVMNKHARKFEEILSLMNMEIPLQGEMYNSAFFNINEKRTDLQLYLLFLVKVITVLNFASHSAGTTALVED